MLHEYPCPRLFHLLSTGPAFIRQKSARAVEQALAVFPRRVSFGGTLAAWQARWMPLAVAAIRAGDCIPEWYRARG